MLVDLRAKGITGKEAEPCWARPHDHQQERHPQRPGKADGDQRHPHRHPAMTTRGFKEEEARHGQPDRRRAGQPARRSQHRRRARQGQRADQPLPGLPLISPRRHEVPVLQPPRDPGRRDPGVRGRGLHPRRRRAAPATSASPPTSGRRSASRPSSRRTAGASNTTRQAAGLFQPGAAQAPGEHRQVDAAIERIEEKLLNLGQREVPPAASASW
jgi:hypothetical protein